MKRLYRNQQILGIGAVIICNGKILPPKTIGSFSSIFASLSSFGTEVFFIVDCITKKLKE